MLNQQITPIKIFQDVNIILANKLLLTSHKILNYSRNTRDNNLTVKIISYLWIMFVLILNAKNSCLFAPNVQPLLIDTKSATKINKSKKSKTF